MHFLEFSSIIWWFIYSVYGMNKMKNRESVEQQKSIDIREATLDDAFAIAEINYKGRKNNFKGIIDDDFLDNINLEKKQQAMLEMMENNNWDSIILVHTINWKVVWFIHWWIDRYPNSAYDAEIYSFYVDPDFQWKWIGKTLMNAIIESDMFKNISSFYLRTLKDQKATRHFYEKMWWKVCAKKGRRIWWKRYDMVAYNWKKQIRII